MAMVRRGRFQEAVQRNKRMKKLLRLRESGVFAVDTDRYIKDLEQLHSSRLFRAWESKDVLSSAQMHIVKGAMQNSAYRSNAVTIKMTCFKVSRLLEKQIKAAASYLSSHYSEILRSEYSTIKEREKAIELVLEDFTKLKDDLESVVKLADILINDLDQTYWSIKLVSDAMALSFQRERNI